MTNQRRFSIEIRFHVNRNNGRHHGHGYFSGHVDGCGHSGDVIRPGGLPS